MFLSSYRYPNTSRFCRRHGRYSKQRGAVLVIALLLLIVITLLAVTAAHRTALVQKTSANFYDQEISLQAAESALRMANSSIVGSGGGVAGFVDCSPSRASAVPCATNPFKDPNLPAGAIVTVPTSQYDPGDLAAGSPQYVVEYLGKYPDSTVSKVKQVSNCSGYGSCVSTSYYDFYRITARSSDGTIDGRPVVVLQSVFRR